MDYRLLQKTIGGLGALVLVLASGCQGAPSNAPQGGSTAGSGLAKSTIDPCSVLTNEDISSVLGQTVSEAKLFPGSRPTCKYFLGSKDSYVVVYVFSNGKGGFEIGKKAQDENPQTVSGVGDDAYWSPSLATLNVLKGTTYLMVQFIGVESGSILTAKQLALKALRRLP